MNPFDKLFDSIHLMARSHGMGNYFDAIKEEVANKRIWRKEQAEELQKDLMKIKLIGYEMGDSDYLLVECKSGTERKYCHNFADEQGLKSMTIRTKKFDPVSIYHCKSCKKNSYFDELNCQSDYSTISGSYYGETLKCKCGDTWIDSGDSTSDDLKMSYCHNAVIIGKSFTFDKVGLKQKIKHSTKQHAKEHVQMVERKIIKLHCDNVELLKELFESLTE